MPLPPIQLHTTGMTHLKGMVSVPVLHTESDKVCNCNITTNINIKFYVHVTDRAS